MSEKELGLDFNITYVNTGTEPTHPFMNPECVDWCTESARVSAHNELLFGLTIPLIAFVGVALYGYFMDGGTLFGYAKDKNTQLYLAKVAYWFQRSIWIIYFGWLIFNLYWGMFAT